MMAILVFLTAILQLSCGELVKINDRQSIVPGKSPNDGRIYQAVTLQNGMKVLFIYSQFITKSVMSVSVGVGSLYNPDRSLGLAHFLQHMLFMGSKKFPIENQYASFIQLNAGQRNAFTNEVQTNYYFQIKNSGYLEAVERLIDFFVEPKLYPQSIQRQRNIVNEQFVVRVSDDTRRRWQVIKQLAQPPFSRFSTGNLETLSHQYIRDDLIQFYNKYYSANLMSAVIYSNIDIGQMKKYAIPLLEQIPNKEVILGEIGPHFTRQNTGKLVRMQSIKDKSIVYFKWPVDFLPYYYQSHVSDYISHVLGHEGKNSLLSYLKKKNYVSAITSNLQNIKTQTVIFIEVKLTDAGQQNLQEVYNIVMSYTQQMKAQKYIFQQRRQKNMIDFQFKQKQSAAVYARSMASRMQIYPLKHLLNSSIVYLQYQQCQQKINQFIKQLNPQNVIVILATNRQLENPIVQKYFGVKYTVEDLPQRRDIDIKFEPMPQNPFIPINTTFYPFPQSSSIPKMIQPNVYFVQDSLYEVSKGGIQLRIYSQQSLQFLKFYSKYLSYLLQQLTYPAETLTTKVEYDSGDCVIISLFGFSDTVVKVIRLISQKIKTVHNADIDQNIFNLTKNDLIQTYNNFYNRKSDDVADDLIDIILIRASISVEQMIQQLKSYKYRDVRNRIRNFWNKNLLKWVIVGNFQQRSITNLVSLIEKRLKGTQSQKILSNQCLKLKQNIVFQHFLSFEQLGSSTATVYYEAGPYSDALFYRLSLMRNLIDQPFFNELRTIRKLAYSLSVSVKNTRGTLGLQFTLASSTRDPKNISLQIKQFVEKFFGDMRGTLLASNSSLFNRLKKAIFTQISSPLNNLKSLFITVVKQVRQNTLYFNRRSSRQASKYVNPIQISELVDIWQKMRRNTLQIYVVSIIHKGRYLEYGIKASTIKEIKQRSQYWEDLFFCCK